MSNPSYPQRASSIIALEHRCNCGKLLFKGLAHSSEIEIKCKSCHAIVAIGKNEQKPSGAMRYSVLFTLEGNIIDVSDSAEDILGWTKQQLVTKKIQEMYPLLPMSTYAHLSNLATPANTQPFTWDTLCQNSKGEFMFVKINLLYVQDRSGTKLAMIECTQHLQEYGSEPQMQNHCKFVSKIDAQGSYTYVGMQLATLLGYPSVEMLGKPIEHVTALSKNILSKESFKVSPHHLHTKNGDVVQFESYFAADHNDRGQFNGFQIMSWQMS